MTAVFTDGNLSQDQLWIDGVQQTLTQRQGTPTTVPLVSTAASIGNYISGNNAFAGTLDEFAFFNRKLSAAEIQAEFNAQNSGHYSAVIMGQSPVAYYRLGESGGQVAYDSSGNFNNGTFGTGVTPGSAGRLGRRCRYGVPVH